jgi:hypothetical protein
MKCKLFRVWLLLLTEYIVANIIKVCNNDYLRNYFKCIYLSLNLYIFGYTLKESIRHYYHLKKYYLIEYD